MNCSTWTDSIVPIIIRRLIATGIFCVAPCLKFEAPPFFLASLLALHSSFPGASYFLISSIKPYISILRNPFHPLGIRISLTVPNLVRQCLFFSCYKQKGFKASFGMYKSRSSSPFSNASSGTGVPPKSRHYLMPTSHHPANFVAGSSIRRTLLQEWYVEGTTTQYRTIA